MNWVRESDKVVSRSARCAGLLLALLVATPAHADPPCSGCVLELPAKTSAPLPLLVVLHGDRDRATNAIAKWRVAKTRGWAVLALQCPTSEGCKDSWWQWNGDPSWLHAQIDKVATSTKIDRARIVLAGWSGGATYLGMRAAEWKARALVIHGGGMRSRDQACPKALPAYFLVGDKNPLHDLAVELRDYFTGCKQKIEWDLVKGGDHDREDRALDGKKALAILDWVAR
jgi:predicted esterase